MRQWHMQWALAALMGIGGLSGGVVVNAQQVGETPPPPVEVDVAEEGAEPAAVETPPAETEPVESEPQATETSPVDDTAAPLNQPPQEADSEQRPLPTPDETETVERGVIDSLNETEAEVDRRRRGVEDATAETLDGPRPAVDRDPLGLETPDDRRVIPGRQTPPADARSDFSPRTVEPRITAEEVERRRAEEDRNAAWRFVRHADRWWYWTPQGHWMIYDGSKWVRYEEGAVVPHAAGYRATAPIDLRVRTFPGVRVYSGTRYVPGAGYDGVGGYYQVPRYGYGYQGFYGSYYDYGPYDYDYYDPYYDRGWIDPGAARGANIGSAIGGAIGGIDGARIGAGIGADIGRGR